MTRAVTREKGVTFRMGQTHTRYALFNEKKDACREVVLHPA